MTTITCWLWPIFIGILSWYHELLCSQLGFRILHQLISFYESKCAIFIHRPIGMNESGWKVRQQQTDFCVYIMLLIQFDCSSHIIEGITRAINIINSITVTPNMKGIHMKHHCNQANFTQQTKIIKILGPVWFTEICTTIIQIIAYGISNVYQYTRWDAITQPCPKTSWQLSQTVILTPWSEPIYISHQWNNITWSNSHLLSQNSMKEPCSATPANAKCE